MYGITTYSVAQRKKEMAIRMAFGADRSGVFGLNEGDMPVGACRIDNRVHRYLDRRPRSYQHLLSIAGYGISPSRDSLHSLAFA